ncbi:MAG: LamG-like jellyroll fold domain-containing protein [Gammaproteobacteria bacterium]
MKTMSKTFKTLLGGGLILLLSLVAISHAEAQTCVQPPSGLVSWQPGDGNADDIQGGHDGTLENGATFTAGMVNQAFSFNGSSWVNVADDPAFTFGSGPFTIDLWVNFNQLEGRDPFVGHDEGGGNRNKWIFWSDDVGHGPTFQGQRALRFHINSPTIGPIDPISAPWNPVPRQWHHVAVTRDGSNYALYIDGVQVATRVDALAIPDAAAPLTIGRAEAFFLDGLLDEVEVFNRALSATEVQAIFNAGSAGKCKGVDTDGDGVPDDQDICPGFDDSVDTDSDGVPDGCDACPQDAANDADGDGICGDSDACALGDDRLDADGDGTADACDLCPQDAANDADNDGICGNLDNCPTVANTNQSDADGDGIGDDCEVDNDGDGISDDNDNCPLEPNVDQADADGDGIGDVCDADNDNDGVVDAGDLCPGTPLGEPVLANGCSIDQQCQCNAPWKNHGAYVSCVAQGTEELLNAGQITEAEKDAIVSAAGQSNCGKKK